MSPAPQGNLEVEKYIGSYLISQRVPPNVKTSSNTKRYQTHHHVKPKNVESEKIRTFNKFCYPQREHHAGGPPRYSMPPGQLPLPVECQGYNNNHYKHNAGGSGWAGVPLISMTSGNHRRNKKIISTTNPNQPQKYVQKNVQQAGYPKGKDVEDLQPDSERSPLTKLAIHTQGAPLIQAGRYVNNNRCRNNFNRDQNRVFRGDCNRWEAAKDLKPNVSLQNKDQGCGNTDSLSVASDESSGNSENSLPRIIKPRKRRKKDRKPIASTSVNPPAPTEASQYQGEYEKKNESNSKPFLPLCFDHNAATYSSEKVSDLLPESTHISSTIDEKQSDDLIDPLTSADEFPFGNLLDDEEDNHSELSSCIPATLCQCRYCDPSGVIWDVDQRCYSPFLTPPSPTDGKLQFSNSLPLTFSHITSSFSREPTPPSQYSFSGDLGSLLRRSWSDPSSYKMPEITQISKDGPKREQPDSRSQSPVGLQVSSEIVTSPNGHRDIEIKFYSSSSSPESSKSKSGVSDRDQSDRCFVVEE